MNIYPKPERCRVISIASLVYGLLSIISIPEIFWWSSSFRIINLKIELIITIIVFILGIGFPLTAILCGAIDLKRIKSGLYSNKGKDLSITGIALGSVFLLSGLVLFFEAVLFNLVIIK